MGAKRTDEDIARALMSQALGVAIEQNDDGSTPAMFDFRFHVKDGQLCAAEMTTVTDEHSRAWQSHGRRRQRITGSRLQWLVQSRGRNVRFKELLRHLQLAAPLLEARGLRDPRDVPASDPLAKNESVRWLRQSGTRVLGIAASVEDRGRVYPTIDQAGAFVGDSLDPTLTWLEAELASGRYDGEFDKLASSALAEQHLVLRIDLHGIPHAHYFALTDQTGLLPTRAPLIPSRYLTGVWLIPEFSNTFIWWTVDGGWQRQQLGPPT